MLLYKIVKMYDKNTNIEDSMEFIIFNTNEELINYISDLGVEKMNCIIEDYDIEYVSDTNKYSTFFILSNMKFSSFIKFIKGACHDKV